MKLITLAMNRFFTAFLCSAFVLFLISCTKEKVVPVSSVSLSQTTAEMIIGETISLKATVLPNDATDRTVFWASSKQSVATINSAGVVTAISEGTSIITASSGGQFANCSVTVSKGVVLVVGVRLNKTSLKLAIGDEEVLTATVDPDDADDKTVTWSSTNPLVAEVDKVGKVRAIGEGKADIIASAGNIQSKCYINVYDPMPKAIDLGLSVKWASFNIGATAPEEFGWKYAWGEVETKEEFTWENYKWGSQNSLTKYVTDSSYGKYDGKTHLEQEDDAAIKVLGGDWRMPTSEELKELYNNCEFKWEKKNGVDGTTLTSKINGNQIFLPAPMYYSEYGNAPVSCYWSSSGSNTSASMLVSGLMIMSKQYYKDLTTRARQQGLLIRPVYSPYVEVTGIQIDRKEISLNEGETAQLQATVLPSDATNKSVEWASSKTSVATVSSSGLVTAVSEGVSTIVASAGGMSATCSVTVMKKTINVTSVSLNKSELSLTKGNTETLIPTVNPTDATDKTVSWSSSNTSVATVSSTGTVMAIAVGTATVTVTTNDGGKTASCSVTVKDGTEKDLVPPVLQSFTFSPETIDITSSGQTVTLYAHITDETGLSGVPMITIDSPKSSYSVSMVNMSRTSGNEKDGEYSLTVTIPQGKEPGEWSVKMWPISDVGGFKTGFLYPTSAKKTVTVIMNQDLDTTPPVLQSFTFSPETIDITSSSQTVTLYAHITDETGLSGVPMITIDSPKSSYSVSMVNMSRTSGDEKDGEYSLTVTIPQGKEPGEWNVKMWPISNKGGFKTGFLYPTSTKKTVTVIMNQDLDTTPPVLQSFTFSPETIDITSSSQTVTLYAHITDETGLSGVPMITIDSPKSSYSVSMVNMSRTSGDEKDGEYSLTVTIPQGKEPGEWSVKMWPISDVGGFKTGFLYPTSVKKTVTVISN